MRYEELLERVTAAAEPMVGKGRVAAEIPELAGVDPQRFGVALVTAEGEVFGAGDWQVPFSIQSLSKVFALALVLGGDGERLWSRVGREPSPRPFNSLVELEGDGGIPRNPFVNAGAMVVVDRLLDLTGDARHSLLSFLREESGSRAVRFDTEIAVSEAETGHRNAALAHTLAGYGNLRNAVDEVLQHYIWQCSIAKGSIAMSCRDVALAGAFLARRGRRRDHSALLPAGEVRRLNATMTTCGTYEGAGEFSHRVGLPGKSGVGGGILAVAPGRCTICVWSPGLDPNGNSVAGLAALEAFAALTGWSVF